MEIILIAAVAEDNVIGNRGAIPWKISADFKRFKDLTLGHPVIMGRKTYESLPPRFRPLPDRTNIVISRNFSADFSVRVFSDMLSALNFAKTVENDKVFVIGGGEIYKMFLPLANKLEITHVHGKFEGDALFPHIGAEWNVVSKIDGVSEEGLKYSFVTYAR